MTPTRTSISIPPYDKRVLLVTAADPTRWTIGWRCHTDKHGELYEFWAWDNISRLTVHSTRSVLYWCEFPQTPDGVGI